MAIIFSDHIRNLLSRPILQPAWEQLLKLCHAGMNYGGGQSVASSGELGALQFAARRFSINRPIVIFDVGANDGEYIEAIRSVISRDDVRIFSFEPQHSCFLTLQSIYQEDPLVQIHQVALGKECGSVNLFCFEDGESTASLHRIETDSAIRSESVQMRTLDEVCRNVGLESIDLLKIDTEGHEVDVLLGARELIEAGQIDTIQFEFGHTFLHTNYYFHDIFEMLSPRYTIYRILRSGLFEIPHYSHDLEIYKIANFLCVRKDSSR